MVLLRVSRLALAAFALSVPLAASGSCTSRTACFQYTQAEYDVHGSCPAQADALANFSDPHCPGAVSSVDGPGTFDGVICCYSVTYGDIDSSCGNQNGTGGVSTTGPPPGGEVGTSTSTGTFCPPSCNLSLMTGGVPCGPFSSDQYFTLQTCAGCGVIDIDGGAACADVCGSFCVNFAAGDQCLGCLASLCSPQLQDCQNN